MPLHVVNNIINQHATGLDASTQSCVTFWMAKTMDSLITSRLFDRNISCLVAFFHPLIPCTDPPKRDPLRISLGMGMNSAAIAPNKGMHA